MRANLIEFLHPLASIDQLGRLPDIFDANDPQRVSLQIALRYGHGGGYRQISKGKWHLDPDSLALEYPGDPVYTPIAMFHFPKTNEIAIVYEPGSFVLIKEKDSEHFEVVRMD